MAVYKVPQDVEAEDKLIGPFSFRQFIYLIIVAIAGFMAYLLSRIFIGLIIVPLPLILFFGALALPLRKDQPMETYLTAVLRFYLKPRKRMWLPEGTINLVEIIAPRIVEKHYGKDITQDDAQSRFDYLARVMDSRGWSTRGVASANDSVNDVVMAEAEQTEDILDDNAPVAQSFESMIEHQDEQRRRDMIERIQQAQARQAQAPPPAQPRPQSYSQTQPAAPTEPDPSVQFNPYPTNIHQRVILPEDQQPHVVAPAVTPPPTTTIDQSAADQTVPTPVSPDILKLANNSDLSISAIAHEAQRLTGSDSGEVVISLR
ncbi:MAG TPA: PrgI family protein [Candidatus Saccharimonadales bacterium]|jgi:hypothetical protein|nr:PrgI family protein [Candidatus Saccharimonadales bacterium]